MNETAPPALESLLRQQRWLRRLAASLVVDAAQADDLAQQALLSALERPPADSGAPRAWLATVARNLARKFGASERARAAREESVARRESLPPTDEVVARVALQTEVATAVLALDEPYRSALLLRFVDELKPGAIARRLEAPVETVRTRIKRGLELLRAELVTRRAAAAPDRRGGAPSQWAVALVGLLDGASRNVVRRAVLARVSSATFVVGGPGIGSGWGAVGTSAKLKLALVAAVALTGALVTSKFVLAPSRSDGERARAADSSASAVADPSGAPTIEPAGVAATRTAAPVADHAGVETTLNLPTSAPSSGCAIVGSVFAPDGTLAAGTLVWLEDPRDRAGSGVNAGARGLCRDVEGMCNNISQFVGRSNVDPGPGGTFRVVNSPDGHFRFDRLEASRPFNLAAACMNSGVVRVTDVIVTEAESPKSVDLVLIAGVTLTGSVLEERGPPIPGASIDFERVARDADGRENSRRVGAAKSDPDGRFRSLPLPFSGFVVRASAEGFLDQALPRFDVQPGQREAELSFRLARAPTLRGRILSRNGAKAGLASVKDVEIVAVASEEPPSELAGFHGPRGERGKVVVAEDRYEITPRRGGLRYVSIWAGRSELGEREIVDFDLPLDVTVDLDRAPPVIPRGSLVVEVVDAEIHRPIREFNLQYSRQRADHTESEWGGLSRTGCSDPTGSKQIDGLPEGDYDVLVDASGFAASATWATVAADGSPRVVRIELRPAVAHLGGRVVDEDGKPISMARVQLLAHGDARAMPSQLAEAVTDSDGRFAFEQLADASYDVVATGDPLGPAAVTVEARRAGADVVITLRKSVPLWFVVNGRGEVRPDSISFRIRDEQGVPVYDGDRHGGLRTWGSQAQFRLAPATYTVESMSPGFQTGRVSFVAADGARIEILLVPR